MSILNSFEKSSPIKKEANENVNFLNADTVTISNNELQYSETVLSNGKTITEQQQEDFHIALGEFPVETPIFCDMKIVSSTVPPQDNYALLNSDEQKFFSAFHEKLIEAKYNPSLIRLTRLSSGAFNVDYIGLCYIGKICLYKAPNTYAVIKKGNKRATKVFHSLEEAELFILGSDLYEIQIRSTESENYMQYMVGLTTVKELDNSTLQQCIDTLPRWIKYLNYCKRN